MSLLLAGTVYDPAVAVSVSTAAATAMTAFDTTNLRLTFTPPASGNVMVRIRVTTTGGTTSPGLLLGILSGASVIARQWALNTSSQVAAVGTLAATEALFTVTGLSGSQTWDAAYAVQNAQGTIKYGGPNDAAGADAWGGLQYEIYACPKLLASKLYDPAVAVSVSTTTRVAMTAFDTTNLRLVFTAPSSGSVYTRLRVVAKPQTTSIFPVILMGVLDGATVRVRTSPVGVLKTASTSFNTGLESRGVVTGLTPGNSFTWDAAYAIQTTSGTSMNYGGPNDATGNDAFGGLLYEIWSF